MIRLEGRCNRLGAQSCSECDCPNPEYRCRDCLGPELYCSPCILLAHKWNGQHFERISLKTLGLHIQLGHITGQKCLNPRRAFNDDFIVVDTHGIHEQLLRISWFPSTTSDPKTAATFHVLEHYHLLSFESKVSAFEFYNALSRMSDNTGLLPIKDRYESFTRMIREWRHLKMLKRSGRGHDPSGVDGTVEGECTVLCPACPHPGKNLPAGWKDAPRQWLYGLFLAIDANFRLKRKAISNDGVDPSLSHGWGYFVEDKAYKDFLHSGADSVQEKSTCSSHNTVNMADTKSNHGLATTGLGTVDCARHNMKLPNAVGDLQKGERYINMDYFFFSTLRHTALDNLNISYDIACQWHKKLWHRMSAFPISMHLSHAVKTISFFCQTSFSTDGEAPEHGWANINPVTSSTKEMGPGARRDTLDDYFGDLNWKKVVGLGHAMLYKIKNALPERENHREAFEDLNDGLRGEYGAALKQWREQVEAWEYDPTQPNPFERKAETVTMASVRLELAKEDESDLRTGTCLALHEDCTPSVLISTGLELEEQQRRMKANRAGLGVHATDNQEGKILQRRNALRRRIDAWVKIQELYLPSLTGLRMSDRSVSGTMTAAPEAVKLWLPSQISRTSPCDSRLQAIEWKLRYAQAHDGLRSLRSNLRAQTAVLKYKDRNLRGQGANTRARNTLKAVEARIEAAASTYEHAHRALVVLSPRVNQTGWHSSLRPLDRGDIRSMTDLLWGETEGTRKLSWIWNMQEAAASEMDKDNALEGRRLFILWLPSQTHRQSDMRIEWCKARARAMRWAEEVELLKEEMRRILQFLAWDAQRWDERGLENTLEDAGEEECEGRMAYAKRQASLHRMLAESFKTSWTDTLALVNMFDHSSLITQQDMDLDT
ncbi:uncharacterized protein F5891DRAFT_1132498 [Suillus fuscotomentosus]|uniref:CxC2-like cysteine cluster KDZ transposase-associated domain-containing protein n=1 Tax=Suillus fuscotomentosus TaxID=1912939 RepID=A0AAD4DNI1_9AGAM|nr:uncharacterized protein F5891DRAFT_1132498 [Suillus fuscotomentosus]KAG1886404.1 hypothetical protein F5891DRAFT_1132498 [Suillus fuscotomentosus]